MMRSFALATFLLLPAAAGAQTVAQDVRRPGTFNDASTPLKAVADGAPRSLIRPRAATVLKPVIVADNAGHKTP